MGKSMQTIGGIHAECFAADEHRAGGTQADVAVTFPNRAGAHSCGGVISRTGTDLYTFGQTQGGGCVRFQGAHKLPAFIEMGQPFFLDTADFAHFLAPALVLHVQEQHARSIGIVGGVHTGHAVDQIILGQHDLGDGGVQIRFILLHPEEFWGGEPCKGNVAGVFAQSFSADFLVQIIGLLGGTAIVPQNGRAQHPVGGIQGHQTVHLAAHADALHLGGVEAFQQSRDAIQTRLPPGSGVLLAPACVGHAQGIFPGNLIAYLAGFVNQKEFARRGTQIHADIQHKNTAFLAILL